MGVLFEQYNTPEQFGSEVLIPDFLPAIYVSDSDEVFCYTGIFINDIEPRENSIYAPPCNMRGKHSTDKRYAARIKGFLRIVNGCIILDNYIDNQFKEKKYKLINAYVRLPDSADTYFGIEASNEEDALTRAIFGLTYVELTSVLEGYAKLLGIHNMYVQFPKLTRSAQSENFCDITELWIPKHFPYITFDKNNYDFAHVSLWGFYRHVQLLMKRSMGFLVQEMLSIGVGEFVLRTLLSIDDSKFYNSPKVSRDTL